MIVRVNQGDLIGAGSLAQVGQGFCTGEPGIGGERYIGTWGGHWVRMKNMTENRRTLGRV